MGRSLPAAARLGVIDTGWAVHSQKQPVCTGVERRGITARRSDGRSARRRYWRPAADDHGLICSREEFLRLVVFVVDFVTVTAAKLTSFLVTLTNVIHGRTIEAEALLPGGRDDGCGSNATGKSKNCG